MLTVKSQLDDKVETIYNESDDNLTKPFQTKELIYHYKVNNLLGFCF